MSFQKRDQIRFMILMFAMGWCLSTVMSILTSEAVVSGLVLLVIGATFGIAVWHVCDKGGLND